MSNMKLKVWNVGEGNAVAIRFPNGKLAMIDAHSTCAFNPVRVLKLSGYEKIDWLFITHPHTDHFGALETITTLGMGPTVFVRVTSVPDKLALEQNTDKELVKKYIAMNNAYNGTVLCSQDYRNHENTGGVVIKAFFPDGRDTKELNNYSMVIVVEYAGTKIVCSGDCSPASLRDLLKDKSFALAVENAQVLIAPHHGRESGYCGEFVRKVAPALTVISDGPGNTEVSSADAYGKASRGAKVVDSAGRVGVRNCLTTRNDGDIEVSVDLSGWTVRYNGRMN